MPKIFLALLVPGLLAVIAFAEPADKLPAASAADAQRTARIVERQREIPAGQRLEAVHTLSRRLGPAELGRLREFLLDPALPKGLSAPQIWELKNDLMNVLCEQVSPTQDFQRILLGIFHDSRQDAIMRDYVLQHTRFWYASSADQPALLAMLWEAARGADSSLPGTALLSLWDIGQRFPSAVSRADLGRQALAVAANPGSHVAARISGLQLCGQLGVSDALPLAIQVAETGTPLHFRLAAIAAVGDLGNSGHTALLRAIGAGDPLLLPAATAALEKIGGRP